MTKGKDADRLYVTHILDCIANIESYVQGNRDRFFNDRMTRDAVLHNIQIMAESSQRLSDESKAAHPAIPWSKIAGLRNRIVHDYTRIDLDIIWAVINEDLSQLKAAATVLLPTLP